MNAIEAIHFLFGLWQEMLFFYYFLLLTKPNIIFILVYKLKTTISFDFLCLFVTFFNQILPIFQPNSQPFDGFWPLFQRNNSKFQHIQYPPTCIFLCSHCSIYFLITFPLLLNLNLHIFYAMFFFSVNPIPFII